MPWDLDDLQERLLIGSTLVEGSTLSEAEAREVLRGRTVAGHPIAEIRELRNYRAAVEWVMGELSRSPYASIDLILGLHHRLLDGLSEQRGAFKAHPNFTYRTDGGKHHFVKPARVQAALAQWLEAYNGAPQGAPGRQAAELYYGFEAIHPFADGNGRIGRVLLAHWLQWRHSLRFSFHLEDKVAHLDALEAANSGDLDPLARFMELRVEP